MGIDQSFGTSPPATPVLRPHYDVLSISCVGSCSAQVVTGSNILAGNCFRLPPVTIVLMDPIDNPGLVDFTLT